MLQFGAQASVSDWGGFFSHLLNIHLLQTTGGREEREEEEPLGPPSLSTLHH